MRGYLGDRYHSGEEGHGWSGITVAEKDAAAARPKPWRIIHRDYLDDLGGAVLLTTDARMAAAVRNANAVAAQCGSGYWTTP